MKRVAFAVLSFFLFVAVTFAQETNPKPDSNPQIFWFRIATVITLTTGDQTALYFLSPRPFSNLSECNKALNEGAVELKSGILTVLQSPIKNVKLFGNCQLVGQPQDMMLPLIESENKQNQDDKSKNGDSNNNVMPQ